MKDRARSEVPSPARWPNVTKFLYIFGFGSIHTVTAVTVVQARVSGGFRRQSDVRFSLENGDPYSYIRVSINGEAKRMSEVKNWP